MGLTVSSVRMVGFGITVSARRLMPSLSGSNNNRGFIKRMPRRARRPIRRVSGDQLQLQDVAQKPTYHSDIFVEFNSIRTKTMDTNIGFGTEGDVGDIIHQHIGQSILQQIHIQNWPVFILKKQCMISFHFLSW